MVYGWRRQGWGPSGHASRRAAVALTDPNVTQIGGVNIDTKHDHNIVGYLGTASVVLLEHGHRAAFEVALVSSKVAMHLRCIGKFEVPVRLVASSKLALANSRLALALASLTTSVCALCWVVRSWPRKPPKSALGASKLALQSKSMRRPSVFVMTLISDGTGHDEPQSLSRKMRSARSLVLHVATHDSKH